MLSQIFGLALVRFYQITSHTKPHSQKKKKKDKIIEKLEKEIDFINQQSINLLKAQKGKIKC